MATLFEQTAPTVSDLKGALYLFYLNPEASSVSIPVFMLKESTQGILMWKLLIKIPKLEPTQWPQSRIR